MGNQNSITVKALVSDGQREKIFLQTETKNNKFQCAVATFDAITGDPITPVSGDFVLAIKPRGGKDFVPGCDDLDLSTPDFFTTFDIKPVAAQFEVLNADPVEFAYEVTFSVVD